MPAAIAAVAGKKLLEKVLPIVVPVVAAVVGYIVMVSMMIASSLGGNTTTHHEDSPCSQTSATTTTVAANDGDAEGEKTVDTADQAQNDGTAPAADTTSATSTPAPASMKAGDKVSASAPYREDNSTHTITLTDADLKNIATVIQVAHDHWPDDKARADRAAVIALSVMAVESEFRNLASKNVAESTNYPNDGTGDNADSIGVFQQRVANGNHGSVKQMMDVAFAAKMFLGIRQDGEPSNHDWGLDDFQKLKGKDWLTLDPGDVAADIQRPSEALRYRYGLWTRDAAKLVSGVAGHAVDDSCSEPFSGSVATSGKDDYPYKDMPHCDEDYSSCPAAGTPLGTWPSECTDFGAWRVNQELGSTKPPYKFVMSGWARDWLNQWKAKGWPTGSVPHVGDLEWYPPGQHGDTTIGASGHIAVVGAVYPDGTILETGYNGMPAPNDHKYYERKVKATDPGAYLYLPDHV